MTRGRFNSEAQWEFAELSGDFNPMHIDPLAARRYLFGRQVAHGVHGLLWALDWWLTRGASVMAIGHLHAVFERPIGLKAPITLRVETGAEGAIQLDLYADGIRSTKIVVQPATDGSRAEVAVNAGPPPRRACREWPVEQLVTASGEIDLYLDEASARRLFPRVFRRIPRAQLAVLLATTRLVGMECPGLHSVLAELAIGFGGDAPASNRVRYEVGRYDRRFSLLTLKFRGGGANGTIKAFVRPSVQTQASFAQLRPLVAKSDFSGQHALVIGGSRGLGEVTAKLLAAGGAEVVLTYHRGREDAERVVADIVGGGGDAKSIQFDALQDDARFIDQEMHGISFNHLYYFATPAIFRGVKGTFQAPLFRQFCRYYVTGFANAVVRFRPLAPAILNIFYPSTVAVDEDPAGMAEYVAAKMAGERLCKSLVKHERNICIYCPRLPRAATDQTASLVPVAQADAVSIMLQHLRRFVENCPYVATRSKS